MGKQSELTIKINELRAERDELDRLIERLEGPHVTKSVAKARKVKPAKDVNSSFTGD